MLRERNSRWKAGLAGALVVVALLAFGALRLSQPTDFTLIGPDAPVRPGETVTIAPDRGCGPLLVTVYVEETFGLWTQTHSGNIFDGFVPDRAPWWQIWSSRTTATPQPCIFEAVSLTVPTDVTASRIAACDQDRRCVRIDIDQSADPS